MSSRAFLCRREFRIVALPAVMVAVAGVPIVVAAVAGAVVAPTDTVAATSVFRRLNAPERLVTIVEGEGLINDGAALVLYVGAVTAAVAKVVRPCCCGPPWRKCTDARETRHRGGNGRLSAGPGREAASPWPSLWPYRCISPMVQASPIEIW